MFTFWFPKDSILYQKNNRCDLRKKSIFKNNWTKIRVLTYKLKTHMIPCIPKEGYMVFKRINHRKLFDFLNSAADLKKYVFINLRKQIRQKMEGFSAS